MKLKKEIHFSSWRNNNISKLWKEINWPLYTDPYRVLLNNGNVIHTIASGISFKLTKDEIKK
jgi:hypothetical protein